MTDGNGKPRPHFLDGISRIPTARIVLAGSMFVPVLHKPEEPPITSSHHPEHAECDASTPKRAEVCDEVQRQSTTTTPARDTNSAWAGPRPEFDATKMIWQIPRDHGHD